jgi:DNA gyrase/topoisomerase IV subunit B
MGLVPGGPTVSPMPSSINSISTIKGGSHVNYIADQVAKNLITAIAKKNKAATIKLPKIKKLVDFCQCVYREPDV